MIKLKHEKKIMKKNNIIAHLLFFITLSSISTEIIVKNIDKKTGQAKKTELELRQAIIKEPRNIVLYHQLAQLLEKRGDLSAAILLLQLASSLAPNHTDLQYCLARLLSITNDHEKALKIYNQILLEKPEYEPAQWGNLFTQIQLGHFADGWQFYKQLFKRWGVYQELQQWIETNTFYDKIIVIRHAGGLGDTLQFIRFAKLIHELGNTIILDVPPALSDLLKNCPYIDQIVNSPTIYPEHDAQVCTLHLSGIFAPTEKQLATYVPYLYADATLVTHWHHLLAQDKKFKIGLSWSGDQKHEQDRPITGRRSLPLNLFIPFAQLNEISLYSLQKGEGSEQLSELSSSLKINSFDTHFDTRHGAFMDTAAVMQNLDLVITIDTAIAHLAGGLGIPVWLMVPYCNDWRWITNRTDSPWYPTMRIFKQKRPFNWEEVIAEIIAALHEILPAK